MELRQIEYSSGVSSAVSVVLLIAVTVALLSLVGVYTFDVFDNNGDGGELDAEVELKETGGDIQATVLKNRNAEQFKIMNPSGSVEKVIDADAGEKESIPRSDLTPGQYVVVAEGSDGSEQVVLSLDIDATPYLEVKATNIPDNAEIGDTINVDYEITNVGSKEGTQDISLLVDKSVEAQDQDITVPTGDTVTGTLSYTVQSDDAPESFVEIASKGDSDGSTVTVEPSVTTISATGGSFESGSASDEGKEQVTVNDQDGNELNTETSASLLSTDYIPNEIPAPSLSIMSGRGIYQMCDTGSVKIEAEYTNSAGETLSDMATVSVVEGFGCNPGEVTSIIATGGTITQGDPASAVSVTDQDGSTVIPSLTVTSGSTNYGTCDTGAATVEAEYTNGAGDTLTDDATVNIVDEFGCDPGEVTSITATGGTITQGDPVSAVSVTDQDGNTVTASLSVTSGSTYYNTCKTGSPTVQAEYTNSIGNTLTDTTTVSVVEGFGCNPGEVTSISATGGSIVSGDPTSVVSVTDQDGNTVSASLTVTSGSTNYGTCDTGSPTVQAEYTNSIGNTLTDTTTVNVQDDFGCDPGEVTSISATGGSIVSGDPTNAVSVTDQNGNTVTASLSVTSGSTNYGTCETGSATVEAEYTNGAGDTLTDDATVNVVDEFGCDPGEVTSISATGGSIVSGDPTNAVSVTDQNGDTVSGASLTVISGSTNYGTCETGSATVEAEYTNSAGDTLTDTTTVNVNEGSTCGPDVTSISASGVTIVAGDPTGAVTVTDQDGSSVSATLTVTSGSSSYTACEKGSATVEAEYTNSAGTTLTDTATVDVIIGSEFGCISASGGTITSGDPKNAVSVTVQNGGSVSASLTVTSGSTYYNTCETGSATVEAEYTNGAGNTLTDTATVNVQDDFGCDPGEVTSISANGGTITSGDPKNAVSVTDQDGGSVSASLTVASGSTYYNTCETGSATVEAEYTNGAGNTLTDTATVNVQDDFGCDPGDVTSISATGGTITSGDPKNAVSVTDQDGRSVSATLTVTLGSTSYTTCETGSATVEAQYTNTIGNTLTDTATVNVVEGSGCGPDVTSISIQLSPNPFVDGNAVTPVTVVDQNGNDLGNEASLNYDSEVGLIVDKCDSGSIDYTAEYTNSAGDTLTDTATATVIEGTSCPDVTSISIQLSPNPFVDGNAFTPVTVVDQNGNDLGNEASLNYDSGVGLIVDKCDSGSIDYTAEYTNSAGDTLTDAATATVLEGSGCNEPDVTSISATGGSIVSGDPTNAVTVEDQNGNTVSASLTVTSGSTNYGTCDTGTATVEAEYTNSAGDTLTDTTSVNVNEGSTCGGPAPSITAVGGSFTTGSVSSATSYVTVTDEDGTDVTAATDIQTSGASGTGGDGYYDTCESGSVAISAEYDHPEAGTVGDTTTVNVQDEFGCDPGEVTSISATGGSIVSGDPTNAVTVEDQNGDTVSASLTVVQGKNSYTSCESGTAKVEATYTNSVGDTLTSTATVSVDSGFCAT